MEDDVHSYDIGAKTAGLASYVFVSKIVSMLIAGAAFIIVARILGPSIYGVYTLAMAVAGLFGMAGDFGIGMAFNKFIAEHKTMGRIDRIDELMSNGLFASLVLGIVLTAAAFMLSGILSSIVLHSTTYTYVLQLASFVVVIFTVATALNSALVGFGKGSHFALMLMVQVIVQSIVSVTLAVAGYGTIAPILGLLMGGLSEIAYALYVIFGVNRVKLVMPSVSAIESIFKFSLPISATTALSVLVSSLAFMVLGAFATTTIAGNVGIASRVGSFVSAFAESISASLLPAFAATIAMKQKKSKLGRFYNYSVHISLIFAVPVLLSIAMLSKQFTFTAFGGAYYLAPLYVSVVGIGYIINIVSSYTSTLLVGSNRVKELLKSYIILTAVQLVAMVLLVPAFNGIGIVILLFIITPVASMLLFAHEVGKKLKIKLGLDKPLRVVLAGIISVAVFAPVVIIFYAQSIALLVGVAIEQLVVYPPVLAMVKGATKKDLDTLKKITRSIPVAGIVIAALADYSSRFAKA